jgi:hypothetical protein
MRARSADSRLKAAEISSYSRLASAGVTYSMLDDVPRVSPRAGGHDADEVRLRRESRDPSARPIDWAGQATLTTGLFLLVLALLRGNGDGWTSAAIMAELSSAAALLALFVLIERNSRAPMLPLTLFRVRAFSGAQLAAFAISASFFAIFLYSTLYLQGILHLSPIQAGLVYLPATGSLFLASAATAQLRNVLRADPPTASETTSTGARDSSRRAGRAKPDSAG